MKARHSFEKQQFMPTKAFQSVEPTLSLKNLVITSKHTDVARSETSVGQPQAGAGHTPALTWQPETRLPRLTTFSPLPCFSRGFLHNSRHWHDTRRKAKQGGAGGIIFPAGVRGGAPHAFSAFPFLCFLHRLPIWEMKRPARVRTVPRAESQVNGSSRTTTETATVMTGTR